MLIVKEKKKDCQNKQNNTIKIANNELKERARNKYRELSNEEKKL